MPYISITRFVDALLPSSDEGKTVTFQELKEAIPHLKEVKDNLAKGSRDAPPPYDRDIVANFMAAVNSTEADGGRLSVEEITGLSSFYFSPEFFDAAAIEANRRGVTNLFSPDAKGLLSDSAREALDATADLKWFELYLKLNECGLVTGFDNAKKLIKATAWNDRLFNDEGFWRFVKDDLVPNYIHGGIVSSDIAEVSCGSMPEDFWGAGIPIKLYYGFKTQLTNEDFIYFAKAIEENYRGIRIIHDTGYFAGLYNDERKRTAIIDFMRYAKELSRHIPFSGPLEPSDLKNIADITNEADIKRLSSAIKDIGYIFGLTEPITIRAIRLLARLNDDTELASLIEKAKRYRPLLHGRRITPRNWLETYYFLKTVSLLPDDTTLLNRSYEKLAEFNAAITFPLREKGWEGGAEALEDSKDILSFISNSENLPLLLERYNSLFPDKPLVFTLDDLSNLSVIDDLSDTNDIGEVMKCIVHSERLIDTLEERYTGRNGKGFADMIFLVVQESEKRRAAIAFVEEFPILTAINELGKIGIERAPQLLEWMRADCEYYDILVNDLGLTDIHWSLFLNEKDRLPTQFQKLNDPVFLDGAKKVLGILDGMATPGQKRYLHGSRSIKAVLGIYGLRPDLFQRIVSLTDEHLKYWLLLAGDVVLVTRHVELKGWPGEFALQDMWSFMTYLADHDLLDALPEFIKRYPFFERDPGTLLEIANAAVSDPAGFNLIITPEFLEWFKTSGLPPIEDIYIELLPKIYEDRNALLALQAMPKALFDAAKGRIFSNPTLSVATSIFDDAPLLAKTKNVKISLDWQGLDGIFNSPVLIRAIKDPKFAPYWLEVRSSSAGNGPVRLKDIIEPAKAFAVGLPPQVIKFAARMGYHTDGDLCALIPLKGKEAVLNDPSFVGFLRSVTKTHLNGSYHIYDLYPLAELYAELGKNDLAGGTLSSKEFSEFNAAVQFIVGAPPSGATLLATFKLLRLGIGRSELRGLKKMVERPVTANDIYTLAIISKDPELRELYHDRPRLEREINRRLEARRPIFRAKLDAGYKDRHYTERPDLKNAETLFLMRAHLILNALEDENFVAKAAELIVADLADKRTEHIFGIDYDTQNKKIELVKVESLSFEDGAASSTTDTSFQNYLATAHLHAVEGLDEGDHAGPSGFYDTPGLGGDIATVLNRGLPDLVITPCGRDESGRLLIDLDLYYASETPRGYGTSAIATKATSFILDLGVYSGPMQ